MNKDNFLVKLTQEQIDGKVSNLYANLFMSWFIDAAKTTKLKSLFSLPKKYSDFDDLYYYGLENGEAVININNNEPNNLHIITLEQWYKSIFTVIYNFDENIKEETTVNSERKKYNFNPITPEDFVKNMLTISEEKSKDYDFIKPQHYKLWKDNNDVNDVIKATLSKEELIGFYKGNILKYQLRLGKKPNEPIERDIEKIKWYQEQLNQLM